jgi:hypothetical protein
MGTVNIVLDEVIQTVDILVHRLVEVFVTDCLVTRHPLKDLLELNILLNVCSVLKCWIQVGRKTLLWLRCICGYIIYTGKGFHTQHFSTRMKQQPIVSSELSPFLRSESIFLRWITAERYAFEALIRKIKYDTFYDSEVFMIIIVEQTNPWDMANLILLFLFN